MSLADDRVNAFLTGDDGALPHAQAGPLAGLTLAVKDIFDVAGLPTGGGNPHRLAEAEPAVHTAPSLQKLLDAGARFVGKTQTDELTFSLMGQNAHYPEPVNTAAPGRVTGGSSSGSAAAVAAGLADIALGSDTGGSIRAPASFCGLIGLRPTHGRVSLGGAMPLAPSFDTFGWFAKDAATYAKVADVLLGTEAEIRLTRPLRLPALEALVLGTGEASELERMLGIAATVLGGATLAPALPTSTEELYWCFRKIQAFEAWATHGAWIAARDRGLGPGVKERFEYGSTIDRATYEAENSARAEFTKAFADLLGDDGVLVMPTVPGAAPLRDAGFNAIQAYRERALQLLCLSGLSGFPQITVPLGTAEGAPFGLSLLGPAGSDRALVQLASELMAAKG
ncbi:amidase [Tianweitania sediminis]|uniref:Amidase n=1 Tax=Tianweitania sediminis TaxID=1502156 RepID=A0A8J7R4W1_9HYPH|nr:amidase [Tianweitania sediminis]MBP0441268.1 amidase [Tianweitania sediminis]